MFRQWLAECFKGNTSSGDAALRHCQPHFVYSGFKQCPDRMSAFVVMNILSKLKLKSVTYRMGTGRPPPAEYMPPLSLSHRLLSGEDGVSLFIDRESQHV
jgi:hypothetical protein